MSLYDPYTFEYYLADNNLKSKEYVIVDGFFSRGFCFPAEDVESGDEIEKWLNELRNVILVLKPEPFKANRYYEELRPAFVFERTADKILEQVWIATNEERMKVLKNNKLLNKS